MWGLSDEMSTCLNLDSKLACISFSDDLFFGGRWKKFPRRTIDKDPKCLGHFFDNMMPRGGKGKSLLTSRQLWINLVYNDFLLTWLVDGQMLHGTISALNKVNQGEYQTSAWNSVRMFGESRRCSPISSESSATQQTNHRLIDLFCWNHNITRALDDCNRIDPIGVILARLQLHAEERTLGQFRATHPTLDWRAP